MTNAMTPVHFYGSELQLIEKDGAVYAAMKPICEAMDLDWESQRQLIERSIVLNSVACIIPAVGADGKNREMTCLPLEYLNGWLFKVPASRYEGSRRDAIIRYQKECYKALYNYWFEGRAERPGARQESITDKYISLLEEHVDLLKSAPAPKRKWLTEEERAEIIRLHEQGMGPAEIGKRVGRPDGTVSTVIRRHRANKEG